MTTVTVPLSAGRMRMDSSVLKLFIAQQSSVVRFLVGSLALLRVPTIETLAASASCLGAFKSPSSTDAMI